MTKSSSRAERGSSSSWETPPKTNNRIDFTPRPSRRAIAEWLASWMRTPPKKSSDASAAAPHSAADDEDGLARSNVTRRLRVMSAAITSQEGDNTTGMPKKRNATGCVMSATPR